MSLFYREEHTTCYNYRLQTSASFKVMKVAKSDFPEIINVDRSVIIFLLKGKAIVTCNNYKDKIHESGEMILLPRNSCCYIKVLEDATIMSCSFVQNIDFCNRFSFNLLVEFLSEEFIYDFKKLPVKERVSQFLSLLRDCLNDGLSCVHFHEQKEKELFLILRAYYSKEELAAFFYPLLGKDMDFKDFVLSNYLLVDDLHEFARLGNLSVDTFKRRFKDAFGEPAHKWIIQRKSEFIYRDIILTNKSFADIALDYKMSSQAYLSTFCKQHFGKSPQELRDKALGAANKH